MYDFNAENKLLEKGYLPLDIRPKSRKEALEIAQTLRETGWYATCYTHNHPYMEGEGFTLIYVKQKTEKRGEK